MQKSAPSNILPRNRIRYLKRLFLQISLTDVPSAVDRDEIELEAEGDTNAVTAAVIEGIENDQLEENVNKK